MSDTVLQLGIPHRRIVPKYSPVMGHGQKEDVYRFPTQRDPQLGHGAPHTPQNPPPK